MCPHLYPQRLYADLQNKRELLWRRMDQEFQKEDYCPNYIMCLEERCNYFGMFKNHKKREDEIVFLTRINSLQVILIPTLNITFQAIIPFY
jgi:hypothetical protein